MGGGHVFSKTNGSSKSGGSGLLHGCFTFKKISYFLNSLTTNQYDVKIDQKQPSLRVMNKLHFDATLNNRAVTTYGSF